MSSMVEALTIEAMEEPCCLPLFVSLAERKRFFESDRTLFSLRMERSNVRGGGGLRGMSRIRRYRGAVETRGCFAYVSNFSK